MDRKIKLNQWREYFTTDRSKILDYLKTNGSYSDLEDLIKYLETTEKFSYKKICSEIFSIPDGSHQFFEFPTDELCRTLFELFILVGISTIQEVGAGSGLMSARLKYFIPNLNITASDIIPCDETFYPVEKKAFREINSSKPILISWLHPNNQLEFIEMIAKNKPEYIFHIGEAESGSCFNSRFLPRMKQLGYIAFEITPKQISKIDYFEQDAFRRNIECSTRTCIILLTTDLELNRDKISRSLSGWNQGNFMDMNYFYGQQDKIVFMN